MPTALAAPMIRSGFSPANNCAIAASSEPTSASDGSRTSSMNSWNWLSGLTSSMSIFVQLKPGVSVGTMNSAGLSDSDLAPVLDWARPTTSTACAWSTPEMNTFWPDRIQSLPSRRAVVVMRCELDPASGSVMANAMVIEPSAMPGSQRFFCSRCRTC